MGKSKKRIMVDMSATLLHHGHVRLLRKAKELGTVIVALTTDEEIIKAKGYRPELNFEERKEILKSIQFVDEVVPCAWKLDESFLDQHNIDLLVHGSDNMNDIRDERLLILPRTEGISTTMMRAKVLQSISELILNKHHVK